MSHSSKFQVSCSCDRAGRCGCGSPVRLSVQVVAVGAELERLKNGVQFGLVASPERQEKCMWRNRIEKDMRKTSSVQLVARWLTVKLVALHEVEVLVSFF